MLYPVARAMLPLALLALFGSNDAPTAKLFKELAGIWHGEFASSESDDASSASVVVAHPLLTVTPAADHLIVALAQMPAATPTLFLKPNQADSLVLVDETAEEIAALALQGGGDRYYFVLRGVLPPRNDQITVAFEPLHLSIAITDQFSSNVTLLTFSRKSRSAAFAKIGQAGIILTVVIALVYGLYKLGDLSDLVTPQEAAVAELIKERSRAADKPPRTKKKQH